MHLDLHERGAARVLNHARRGLQFRYPNGRRNHQSSRALASRAARKKRELTENVTDPVTGVVRDAWKYIGPADPADRHTCPHIARCCINIETDNPPEDKSVSDDDSDSQARCLVRPLTMREHNASVAENKRINGIWAYPEYGTSFDYPINTTYRSTKRHGKFIRSPPYSSYPYS